MLAMTGIWLLVALTDGSQVGLKYMASMEACQAQAAIYRSQPGQYSRVECVGNPIVGSIPTRGRVFEPSELFDTFSTILRSIGQ